MRKRLELPMDKEKPLDGQLTLEDLKASNGGQEETQLTDSVSEQTTHSIPEEVTALDGLTEVISNQK